MGQPSRLWVLFFSPAGYENRQMDPDPAFTPQKEHFPQDPSFFLHMTFQTLGYVMKHEEML